MEPGEAVGIPAPAPGATISMGFPAGIYYNA